MGKTKFKDLKSNPKQLRKPVSIKYDQINRKLIIKIHNIKVFKRIHIKLTIEDLNVDIISITIENLL